MPRTVVAHIYREGWEGHPEPGRRVRQSANGQWLVVDQSNGCRISWTIYATEAEARAAL